MTDWRAFLTLARRHLENTIKTTQPEWVFGSDQSQLRCWCSWTTFSRLANDAGYWTAELPQEDELGDRGTNDGGTWGQPFPYEDLAHVIIPRRFSEEVFGRKRYSQELEGQNRYTCWHHAQDIDGLAPMLDAAGIKHRLAAHALEVKLY
jgi:hypothetical protein